MLHPTAPLFSPQHQTLKPLCVAALKRIFLMCDKDKVSLCSTPRTVGVDPQVQRLSVRLGSNNAV